VSITALAESMDMERSTLTRNLRPLEAQGWVRVGAEGARRARAVEITREGRARLREATTLWQRAHETLRRRLGAEHWAALHAELTRVTQALHGTSVR
jgi:DNA-binding MarR family transcriptional regulator